MRRARAPPRGLFGRELAREETPRPAEDALARQDDRSVGAHLCRGERASARSTTPPRPRSCTSTTASPSNAASRPFSYVRVSSKPDENRFAKKRNSPSISKTTRRSSGRRGRGPLSPPRRATRAGGFGRRGARRGSGCACGAVRGAVLNPEASAAIGERRRARAAKLVVDRDQHEATLMRRHARSHRERKSARFRELGRAVGGPSPYGVGETLMNPGCGDGRCVVRRTARAA